MPVIVVGADTPTGTAVAERLWSPDREVRVFVTDPGSGSRFRERGFKVAIGDVSDESHVEGAALHCFTAVLITEAARDERERSFAVSEDAVMSAWSRAVRAAGVKRVIWVTESIPPRPGGVDTSLVDPRDEDFTDQVAALDEAQ